MIAHGPESVLYVGWDNLHLGGAVPCGADLYGMASYVIGDWSAPKWVSWVALIVAGGLAVIGFRLTANDEY